MWIATDATTPESVTELKQRPLNYFFPFPFPFFKRTTSSFFGGVAAPRLTTGWCQRARLGVAAAATAADAPRKGAFRSLATSLSALPGVFKPVAGQPLADVPRLSHRGLEVNRRLPYRPDRVNGAYLIFHLPLPPAHR